VKYVGLVSGRASIVPGQPLYPSVKTKKQWFNPAAFTAPTNAAGIAGAAYGNLQKNTKFHQKYNAQLRADAFNTFNHPNFSTPNAAISNTSTVGTITAISGTPAYEQRTVEFAAKFSF
jgi:hypothetical protein